MSQDRLESARNPRGGPSKVAEPLHPDLMGELGFLTDLSTFSLQHSPSAADPDPLLRPTDAAEGSPLRHLLNFRDASASSASDGRPVTALRFHTKFENVLLCAHGPRADGRAASPPGAVALWSLDDGRAALQRTLTASAPLSALELFSISPTLVAAGTAVGSVLLWDTRARSALPLSALDMSAAAVANDLREYHGRSKVTALKSTHGASPLFVSVSATGHVCKWNLAHPDRPVAQTVLYDSSAKELAFSALDFPRSAHLVAAEPTTPGKPAVAPSNHRAPPLFVGTLDGHVARMDPNDNLWATPATFAQHDAPVTALHAHPAGNRVTYLDDIVATASHDWTVGVWQLRRGQPVVQLHSFDLVADGAVFDTAWNPQHPSVLCAGDEAGILSLFDLSERLAPPPDRPTWQFAPQDSPSRAPLRKILWSADGKLICAGDENGAVSVWTTTSVLAGLPDAEWMGQFLKGKAAEKTTPNT